MLSGLAFTDERETRKERKRDDRKSRKKESKSKKQRRAERDASEEDATERRRRDSTSASASEERTRVHEGARERPISPQQATDADAPAEQSDFFSAALASKARSRADEGKEAERRKEQVDPDNYEEISRELKDLGPTSIHLMNSLITHILDHVKAKEGETRVVEGLQSIAQLR